MALSEWESFSSNIVSFSLDTVDTIVGTSSLKILHTASSSAVFMPKLTSVSRPQAIAKGSYKMLVKPVTIGTAYEIGFTAMHQSVRNPFNISATGYVGFVSSTLNAIRQYSNGPGIGTVIASSAGSISVGTVFSLEFEWISDITNLGGVSLILRRGTLTDFSDLITVASIVDVSSPFSQTFGEGIYSGSNAVGPVSESRVDQTTLFRLT